MTPICAVGGWSLQERLVGEIDPVFGDTTRILSGPSKPSTKSADEKSDEPLGRSGSSGVVQCVGPVHVCTPCLHIPSHIGKCVTRYQPKTAREGQEHGWKFSAN